MNSKSIIKSLVCVYVLVISASAQAYLRPGEGGGGKPSEDPNRPGQYQPGPGQGGGYNPPPQYGGGGHDGGWHGGHGGGDHDGGWHGGHGGGGGYYPPPSQPYYPPSQPYYPPPPPPSEPYYPPAPPAPVYGQRIVQQVQVGRAFQNETYQLSYWANLNTQYYGWEVSAVRAATRPNSPYQTVVQLITASNQVLATQINPGYQIALFPNYQVFAGYQDLFLTVQGSTYIDSIEVELIRR